MRLAEEAHYIVYRALREYGFSHERAYDLATDLLDEMRAIGLTFRREGLVEEKA